MRHWEEFSKGFIKENPIFFMALGLCPTLAVSTSIENAIGMGLATTFVLVCSNIIISLIKSFIPAKVRIPCYITVIATFVTIVNLVMEAYFVTLYKAMSLFLALIVVNCIILGRAEAFASRNNTIISFLDGLGMGFGFTLGLMLMAFFRELLGSNKLLGLTVFPGFKPATMLILPPGGFLVIGLLMGLFGYFKLRKSRPIS